MDILDIMMAKALSGGGGSSSGGDSDLMIVPVTTQDLETYSTDTAYADVVAAIQAGKTVIYKLVAEFGIYLSASIANSNGAVVPTFLAASGSGIAPLVLYHTADGISADDGRD